ncbi:PAS domain S-box-containing protein [Desulfocicer vacuolatum DSM 3385]|uniref:histidine kinase n=1 Tax=Desulfocicer vacuolatum DSM 3385 TaxID=1121400 RepID=A0A1W2AZ24_9BACT|nr:response regulator [Desulfocicer vacuolatum]SMC65955.1 PAS domain S-box-containing protein [Desulfocicer vacuolatum DSM 3385]
MQNILIVDDMKVNLKVLEVLLSRNGYNTTAALSGKDAMDLLRVKPVDLIISDILMPEMDGFQFCRLCKLDENLKHIPFIFYSSTHTESTARKLAGKVGAKAFITKPADPAMLLKTIDTILDGRDLLLDDHEESMADNASATKTYNGPDTGPSGDQNICRALLKNIPCAVWTVNSGGNITYISPAVESITGFAMEHLLKTGKRQWLTRVHPDHVQSVKDAYKNLYRNRIALDIEYCFECRNGEFIWLHEKSGLPYTKKGIQYVDGVSLDISEKKFLQAHRMESRERQTMQTFSQGIARDLNTFITGITGYIELSGMACTTPSEQQDFLTGALEIAQRASQLTRQLATLSDRHSPTMEKVLLSEVITAATHGVFDSTGIDLKLDIPTDLWPCRVDPGPMTRAMTNVLLNAKESLGTNGFIEVVVQNLSVKKIEFMSNTALSPGDYTKITIRDNGRGIKTEHLHRIFQPYFTTKPRKTSQGKGLGLTMSQAVITRHGGVITATSPGEAGTTMNIYIPASRTTAITKSSRFPGPATDRILMVDDDETVQPITCQILEREGFQVTCVKTETDAVKTCKNAMTDNLPFSLVIVNLMADENKIPGLTILKQLKTMHPDLPCIASSIYTDDALMQQYKHHGFNVILPQPHAAGELVAAVRQLLRAPTG